MRPIRKRTALEWRVQRDAWALHTQIGGMVRNGEWEKLGKKGWEEAGDKRP